MVPDVLIYITLFFVFLVIARNLVATFYQPPHLGQVSRVQALCVNVLTSIHVALTADIRNRARMVVPESHQVREREKRNDVSSRSGLPR